MPYASIPGLADLQNRLQGSQVVIDGAPRVVSTLTTQFLESPDVSGNWTNMVTGITAFITTYSTLLAGLRVLVTLSDGHVAYDSSKGVNNTFANFQSNTINENHNTRVAILTALLGNSNLGFETKFSTSTGISQAYCAARMGLATSNALGCLRVSVNSS